MALVDRYLQAVKFWLPRKQKDDIIAELSEDLLSQIEDQEAELGRKLTDTDVEPILKRCGSPMAVAERYLPQRSLIGPALFPIYSVVIRALLVYFLLPWLLLWLGITIFSPDFRADHLVVMPLSDASLCFDTCLVMRAADNEKLSNGFGRSFLRRFSHSKLGQERHSRSCPMANPERYTWPAYAGITS